MGQQQLLLIVLGVIIVGIAVVAGLNIFNQSAFESNRDAVILDLNQIAQKAQQYLRKPASMGGPTTGDFTGVTLATLGVNPTNENGSFAISGTPGATLVVTGTLKEDGDGDGTLAVYSITIPTVGTPTLATVTAD
ncbi:hypothetical protein DRQ09_00965 [candidate division KSB1 bacterium]|mgnify:CR=1 FL=1|nr:MAG: hypothetical protein DRQ09_00965 [candidate division KSB1 bacterium]